MYFPHICIGILLETQRGQCADLWKSFCIALSSPVFCPTVSNCLSLPQLRESARPDLSSFFLCHGLEIFSRHQTKVVLWLNCVSHLSVITILGENYCFIYLTSFFLFSGNRDPVTLWLL